MRRKTLHKRIKIKKANEQEFSSKYIEQMRKAFFSETAETRAMKMFKEQGKLYEYENNTGKKN